MQPEPNSQAPVQNDSLSYGEILKFFAPLALTSMLMMSSHSLGSKAMVNTSNPALSLAAMSVAQSLALMFEGAVIVARQTGVALVKSRQSWYTVLRLFQLVVLALIAAKLVIAFTPLGLVIFRDLLGAPPDVALHAVYVFRFFLIFPAISCLRMLYHSLILIHKRTVYTTIAMVCRIMVMITATVIFMTVPTGLGGGVGAIVLMGGIGTEAVVSYLAGRRLVRHLDDHPDMNGALPLALSQAFRFYLPLAISGIVVNMSRLAVSAGLARTSMPTISLAAYQVSWTLSWAAISPITAVHQITAVFARGQNRSLRVKRFVTTAAVASCALLVAFVVSGAAEHVLRQWIGVNEELVKPALWSIALMAPVPLIIGWSEMLTGALLATRDSLSISTGRVVYVAFSSSAALLGAQIAPALGAALAPIAISAGTFAEMVFLLLRAQRTMPFEYRGLLPLSARGLVRTRSHEASATTTHAHGPGA